MKLFAQLTKVDVEKRLVYGRAADETPDKSGEMLNYDASKPHFQKWSSDIAKDTGGASLGNVRAMHGKVAAGKLTDLMFDDTARTIDVCAKVVDDNEWNKVLEGVYTGFSIGGSYGAKEVQKVDGKDVTRYVAIPNEISLVDRPCIPSAKFFQVQKADGTTAEVEFKAPDAAEEAKRAELFKVLGRDADDDISTEDLTKLHAELLAKQDPVVEVHGTQDEIIEFGKMMNEKGLTMAQVIALVKGDGAADPDDDGDDDTAKPDGIAQDEWDKMSKEQRKAACTKDEGGDMEQAEKAVGEAVMKLQEATEAYAAKLGKAEVPASIKAHADAIHKAAVSLGAACMTKAAGEGDLNKGDTPEVQLQKMVDAAVAPLQKALTDAQDQIKKLEAQPAPTTVSLRAITKADDGGSAAQQTDEVKKMEQYLVKDAQGEVHPAASLLKVLHQQGGRPLLMPEAE